MIGPGQNMADRENVRKRLYSLVDKLMRGDLPAVYMRKEDNMVFVDKSGSVEREKLKMYNQNRK